MYDEMKNNKALGVGYGILAFTVWGLLPLYWKLLNVIPSDQIFAHRIFWSFVFVFCVLIFKGRWNDLKNILENRKNIFRILLCAITISINWFTYIWAVNTNHIVEVSMGYYINPLVVILLAMIVLKERLNFLQYVSLFLASIGVIIITVQYGKIPWIALTLAVSFALYGLFKKMVKVESFLGLALETAILMPMALVFIIYKQNQGAGVLGMIPFSTTLLLMLSGIATAIPLLWFAKGTERVELSTIGFLQYISPTISLFLGIFVFKEHFTRVHMMSFGFIWAALIVYSLSQTRLMKKIQPVFAKGQ